jgi:hypothetical protein
MADKTECYWLVVHTGDRPRNLGIYMTAGVDAPRWLCGRHIFLRLLKGEGDVVMRADDTTGVDKTCYEFIKDKVEFIVTYAAAERAMFVARPRSYTFAKNYGQGLQQRAYMANVHRIDNVPCLIYPRDLEHRKLDGEEPTDEGMPKTLFDLMS